MKKKRLLALLLLAALALGALVSGCSSSKRELHTFTATTLDGGTFTQEDIAAKDVTVINFWGTFCSPCVAEMPDLAAFAKALPDNVQLITVCIDALDDPDGAKALLAQAGYEGVTLVSGDGDFQKVFDDVQAFPTTIFVDSKGNPVGKEILGGQEDLSGTFLAAVNAALKAGGKAEIRLEK